MPSAVGNPDNPTAETVNKIYARTAPQDVLSLSSADARPADVGEWDRTMGTVLPTSS